MAAKLLYRNVQGRDAAADRESLAPPSGGPSLGVLSVY